MKKLTTLLTCLGALCLFTLNVHAQQPQANENTASVNSKIKGDVPGIYTYKIFQAPNKLYGYDILKNGRNVFHQTVPASPLDPLAIKQKKYAEKAAMLSIEKLRSQTFAGLSPHEIKKIVSQ
jgi:hypothetical protein